MRKLNLLYFPIIMMVFLMTFSCKLKPFPEDDGNEGDDIGEKIEEDSDLFLEEEDTGKYIFETNETKYIGEYGYTLWTLTDSNVSDNFEPLDINVYKSSGTSGAGFGIVFCQQIVEDKDFMIAVLINTQGQYIAGKVTDGQFESYSSWKSSTYIKRGYGISNNIKISYESDNECFVLKINGYEITKIKVSEPVSFKKSKSGYAVVIDRAEKFPDIPVKVVFEKNGE